MTFHIEEPFKRYDAQNGVRLMVLQGWDGVNAGFTSRVGGVSQGCFDSLNCGLHVSDEPADVIRNRHKLADAIGVSLTDCTYGEQVHGKTVARIAAADKGKGVESRDSAFQETDGFVTNVPGVYLHALFADCVPLYFWDPVRKAAGLSHAGWKGSVLQIAEETVAQMRRLYGTAAKDLKAAIGPSIGMCCYEVDDTVIRQVENALKELGQVGIANREAVYRNAGNGKYMLSLQQLNRQIMIKAGIPVSNIEVTSLCTSCLTDTFYSHRKEGGKTGRMAAWIGIHA